jgi:hypothetical protein
LGRTSWERRWLWEKDLNMNLALKEKPFNHWALPLSYFKMRDAKQ